MLPFPKFQLQLIAEVSGTINCPLKLTVNGVQPFAVLAIFACGDATIFTGTVLLEVSAHPVCVVTINCG